MNYLLTWVVLVPLLGSLAVGLTPKTLGPAGRVVGLFFSLLAAALGFCVLADFDSKSEALQLVVDLPWLTAWGIHFHLGVDGLNIGMTLTTLLLTPMIILSSWSLLADDDFEQQRVSTAMILMMEAGALGTFLSQDLFLFYIFWEIILIPAYIMLGMYGTGERVKIALQFFLYTFAGSLFMFFSILWLLWQQRSTGHASAAIADLLKLQIPFDANAFAWGLFTPQGLVFLGLGIGFFVKAPLIPLHGWLYTTYKNSPMLLSIYLSAILSKMGTYGVLKILLPLAPAAAQAFMPVLLWVAAIGVIYGGLLALAQKDLKSLIAYSSLSHVSGILLGLFCMNAVGMTGSLFQMPSHAIIMFGLFWVTGIIERRVGTGEFAQLGGIARHYPMLAIAFFCLSLAALAMPGTNGFVGDFLILLGSFHAATGPGILIAFGMILVAAYMLKAYQAAMFGAVSTKKLGAEDLKPLDRVLFGVMVLLIFIFGFFPRIALDVQEPAIAKTVAGFFQRQEKI